MDLLLWCDDWHLYGRGISLHVGAWVALPVLPMDGDRALSILGPWHDEPVPWQVDLYGDGRGDLAIVRGRLCGILQVDHAATVRRRGEVALLEPNWGSTRLIPLATAPAATLEPFAAPWEDGDTVRADTALLLSIESASTSLLPG